MALAFQYNKTALQKLEREMKIRLQALPTLAAKETALRLEVHKAKLNVQELQERLRLHAERAAALAGLWHELPEDLLMVSGIELKDVKIAGVAVQRLDRILFSVKPYSLFGRPAWLPEGIELLKQQVELCVRIELARRAVATLELARRKTTQKVNLYEKVQIPAYREAMLKIKRFLEDEDNLAKSAQKILKARLAQAEAA